MRRIFRKELFFQISQAGGFIAVVAFPVSITLSQTGLLFAVLGWMLWSFFSTQTDIASSNSSAWKMPFIFPAAFRAGLLLYAVLLISHTFHSFSDEKDLGYFYFLKKSEIKDVLLMAAGLWSLSYASHEKGRKRLAGWIKISAGILVGSGFVSLFTIFRLSRIPYHLLHGWNPGPLGRFQHFAGTLFSSDWISVYLYVPVGFMNTHLTYAALLSMVVPGILFSLLNRFIYFDFDSIRRSVNAKGLYVSAYFRNVIHSLKITSGDAGLVIVAILTFVILAVNNGRSAIVGLLFSIAAGLYYYIRTIWKKKAVRLLYPLLGIVFIFLFLVVLSSKAGSKFQETIESLSGKEKLTDYQRVFLWQGVRSLISENPVIGVGPGRFSGKIDGKIIDFSIEHPEFWYSYSVIQRGHAHNDFLHFLAVGGPFAAFFYILIFIFLFYKIFQTPFYDSLIHWKWGAFIVLAGGLFQCYFQDDEVLLPFWIFASLVYMNENKPPVGGNTAVTHNETG